jgi:hypothetical protein
MLERVISFYDEIDKEKEVEKFVKFVIKGVDAYRL